MENRVKTYLKDIQGAIIEINEFLPIPRLFSEFKKDQKTKRAVERNLEIIGEAIGRIMKIEASIEISHSRKIVDTRNRIIHGYDLVSDEILWTIIIEYLPKLEEEVNNLLLK